MLKANTVRAAIARKGTPIATIALYTTALCLIAATQTQAQPANIQLNPGFTPNPLQAQGQGGGTVSVPEIVGAANSPTGPCAGFADQEPNHTLVLSEFFNALSLQVQSSEDTALAIQGPGGVWCNDDFEGSNPGVTGQWLAGTYKIWVSSYGKGRSPSYTLRISEDR